MVSPLLKIKDVASQLGVSKALIYDLVHKGELKCIRFRTEMRIRQEDIDTFLAGSAISETASKQAALRS